MQNQQPEKEYDVVIIGAGAAGLMCALTAGQRGRRVLILDHANHIGKKILISGGGKCNFTNRTVEPQNYLSANPHFCKSALHRYDPTDFISLLESYQIGYEERKHGQLFCTGKSSEIVNLLSAECRRVGVQILTRTTVGKVKKKGHFNIDSTSGLFFCESLVIASGGLSIPQMGASGFGYDLARQFGLNIHPHYPGLVPLTLAEKMRNDFADLTGISVDAGVSCHGKSFREKVLFTHRGLSGPAILQISNYWQPGDEIELDLFPDLNLETLIKSWQQEHPKTELKNLLGTLLSKRLVDRLLEVYGQNRPVKQYTEKQVKAVADIFHRWRIRPSGTEGFAKAEVTKGGVDTNELSSKTFEAKKVPGLFFIGEVVDVTGWLGGFNLQWAWASGFCAGQFV
ncbi:MAG: NAD(P)/FAD-dependent oxidoreductase [Calditrichales bacterium]|nr:MAG: NAD(P)/FAD-dependent oxidoreductase [Calditrichales bacterium]